MVYLRDTSTKIGISSKLRPPWTGPFLITNARPPVYTILGKKRTSRVHHDRLKPCNDSTYPLWLQRKRHSLLNTLPIAEGEDHDSEWDVSTQEDVPDMGLLFDPDETLPYMLGDDSEGTLPLRLGDADILDIDQGNDAESSSITSSGDPELDIPENLTQEIQKKTRAGRNIKLPARFRE